LWFELVRQLDLFFMLVELAVIVWARRGGFTYGAAFRALPRDIRWAVILFLATFWIGSVFVTNFTPYSIVRAGLWPVHLLFGAALWHLGGRTDASVVRRLIILLLAGYFAYLPFLAVHLLSAPDPSTLPLRQVVWTSSLPGYNSVRHFGIELGALLAMLLGLVWRDPRFGGAPVLGFAAIMLVGGAICWSGTRSAMFGVAGAVLMTLVLRRCVPNPVAVIVVLVALLLGGAASLFVLPPDAAFGFRIMPGASSGDYSSGRVQIWIDTFRLLVARPLTGWGEGSVIWLVFFNETSFAHPHNMPLQMLVSWGAPAALAAFYLIARLWFTTQRRLAQHDWLLPIAMAFDTLLIMSMVDGVFYHARMVMLVALVTVVALKVSKSTRLNLDIGRK
jgi:exopolysaccharide production protein ExoQ